MSPSKPEADQNSSSASNSTEDLFTKRASRRLTRKERLLRYFDMYVHTPFSIAITDDRTLVGGAIILLYVLAGTIGVVLIPEPQTFEADPFTAPFVDLTVPLGTGELGQGILKQLIHATPAMFKMILAGSLVSIVLATLIGVSAGYSAGRLDYALMTVTDVVITIPGLVLVILIAAIHPPKSPYVVGLILGIDNWPRLARTIRSQVLSIREQAVVEASRVMGLSRATIFRKDIISNLMPYISVNAATSGKRVIFESIALYFIGVLPFSNSNWGVMLNTAFHSGNLTDLSRIHWVVAPMFTIIGLTVGFVLFAQGLDRVFNVRLKARHSNAVPDEEDSAGP